MKYLSSLLNPLNEQSFIDFSDEEKQKRITDENYRSKYCNSCKKYKALAEFHKDKNGKFGVKARCKTCLKNDN